MTEVGQWRTDPSGRHQYRWWDGDGWTDRVSDRGVRSVDPTVEPAPANTRPTVRRKARLDLNPGGVVAILGGGAAIAGTFLEMAKIQLGPLSATATYWDSDHGKLVAGIAAGVVIVAILGLLRPAPNGLVVALTFAGAATVAGIALYDRIDLDNPDGPLSAIRTPAVITSGPGLYVCIAGGVIAAIGALFAASRR